ncbi:MAG: hypothetical protein ABEJ26_01900 [Halosimplex sp.]
MHDVFSDWERRAILYYLQEREEHAAVDDVAAHLVGWWRGSDRPAAADDGTVRRVRDRLGCAHLEKLDRFGVVTYDPCADTVRLGDEMKVSITNPWSDRPPETAGTARLLDDADR